MKTLCRLLTGLLSILALCHCATIVQTPAQRGQKPVPLTAKYFREKAVAHESRGDLRHALLAWQIAAKIKGDKATLHAIGNLKQTIAAEAELHFKSGLSHYRSGQFTNARNAFLKTIRVQPAHMGARYYLKTRLHMTQHTVYKVRRGDSYSKIASQIYGDSKKAHLIAHFNDHDPIKPLLAGATLLLPVLDTRAQHARPTINAWVKKALKALGQKQYDIALSHTAKILNELSGHPEALKIKDDAHFAKALASSADKQYLLALKHLKRVRPSYKGRNKAMAQARRHILKQALEEKLQLAEQYLSQEAYDSAINASEEIIGQYPDNKRARVVLNTSRYVLAKQYLQGGKPALAAELLQDADLSYKDTGQLLSLARARLRSQAEKHYRKGVNHFINEDLERAIKEWHHALELNPKHPKADQDMQNAIRLLKKYQTLETKQ